MNTQSYQCTRKPDNCHHDAMSQIGDFCWNRHQDGSVDGIIINAPEVGGGSRGIVFIPVQHGANSPCKHWGWDGNEDMPTLTPSVHWIGHWHGYLTAGRLISC